MFDIDKIIKDPVHGEKFYSEGEKEKLNNKLSTIYNTIHVQNLSNKDIIKMVLEYVITNVAYKRSYFDCFNGKCKEFDYNNVKYRTAYGALVEGEAMCAGYAEALRILLNMYNIKSYTVLSKLPLERKKLLHYVVVAKESDDNYIVLDPESVQYCKKNNLDYNLYMESCIYMLPNKAFTNNVLGKDGAGMMADDFLENENPVKVVGTREIKKLINLI